MNILWLKKAVKVSLYLSFGSLLCACSMQSRIDVDSDFLGYSVETRVDSEVARFYLEDYPFDSEHELEAVEDQLKKESIDALYQDMGSNTPNRQQLREVAEEFSLDFASLYFVDRILAEPCNRAINEEYIKLLQQGGGLSPELADSAIVLFVPGWNYIENGDFTGADFASSISVAAEVGIEHYLVPLLPTGSIEHNAELLAEEIRRYIAERKPIVLAGASSAGPAIHLALGSLLTQEESQHVSAWLNVGGILQGTPFVDYMQNWPQRWLFNLVTWWKGWDRESIISMNTGNSRSRYAQIPELEEMIIINYLGVPLSGQFTKYAKNTFPIVRAQGPNDGLTLLADAIAPNSQTIIELGADHFFTQGADMQQKSLALMKLLLAMNSFGRNCEPSGLSNHVPSTL